MSRGRIRQVCRQVSAKGQKAFMGFTTFGYPTVQKTIQIMKVFQDSGVDCIELGVPFSDPLADGPVIQHSSLVALEQQVTVSSILRELEKHRKAITIPIVLLTYYNPVFRMGLRPFFSHAQGLIDGIGVADLLLEEADEYCLRAAAADIDTFFFVTPTTPDQRAQRIARAATGFVYYVSVSGITGAHMEFSSGVLAHIRHIHSLMSQPLFVGFGVSTPDDVKKVCSVADGVIVGSAIIKKIDELKDSASFHEDLSRYLRKLKHATNADTHA